MHIMISEGHMHADDLRDKDREKMKRYFEEHFYTIQQKYMAKK